MSIPLTFYATCDLVAMVRGRACATENGGGVGWVPADLAITAFGGIWDENPFGSLGDLLLTPVDGSSYALPGIENTSPLTVTLARQSTIDGTPWGNDPRHFAEEALARLKSEHGIDLVASFEHEFLLQGLPLEGRPFGLDAFRIAEPFGSELFTLLAENGLEPENWLPEYGAGQFEITLRATDALVAADRAIILREIVRDTARRNNLRASFVPLPHPDSVGNGVHVHLSLWRDGVPITFDASMPGRLSKVASQAFNGILKHADAILGMTAPSQISFLRLQPHRWSSGGAFIAVQDREALLRIAPIKAGQDPARAFNVEFRAADATANPWLVIGTLAHALAQGLSDGEPISNIGSTDAPLPRSLDEALVALQRDEVAKAWYPEELFNTHIGIRETERELLKDLTDVEKCERYRDVY